MNTARLLTLHSRNVTFVLHVTPALRRCSQADRSNQETAFMAKSPEEMIESMIANFKENTGKTLDQWIVIARALKLDKHGAIVKQLKADHGIGHGYANLVAQRTLQGDAPAATG